jgi:hypothetical protein
MDEAPASLSDFNPCQYHLHNLMRQENMGQVRLREEGNMLRLVSFLLLSLLSFGASAQPQAIPTKTISIHNNSKTQTIYPVFQAPIRTSPNVVVRDLWMQALFDVKDVGTQVFPTTVLFTFFVNRNAGIPPGGSVTITIPFYTQLSAATSDNVGKVNDQYIDWWNAMRINLFDKDDAVSAVYNYNVDAGVTIPPIPVVPFNGAAVPTCSPAQSACEPILIKAYKVGYPIWVPFSACGIHLRGRSRTAPRSGAEHQ